MMTSSGSTSSRTRGSSSVVPSTFRPAMRMPCLRGSSSTKPIGTWRSSGLRRSSAATSWPPLPAPTISTSRESRRDSDPAQRPLGDRADQEARPDDQAEREQEVARR